MPVLLNGMLLVFLAYCWRASTVKANRVIICVLETPDRTLRWIIREKYRGENCACGIFELVIFDSCCIVKFVEL